MSHTVTTSTKKKRTVTCPVCGKTRQVSPGGRITKRCSECAALHRGGRLPNGFGTLSRSRDTVLACQDDPDWFARAESLLVPKTSWYAVVDELAAEAQLRCWDCPIQQGCARAARVEDYTGVAGGQVWRDGDNAADLAARNRAHAARARAKAARKAT